MSGPNAKLSGGRVPLIAVRTLLVAGTLVAISYIYASVIRVNLATAAVSYVLIVLLSATRWGLTESLTASVVAAFCFNFFFLAPVHTLEITDPQDWIAFVVFLATSLIVSELSARAKRRTQEILASREEMEKLYAVSCATLLIDPGHDVMKQIVDRIAEIFDMRAVVLHWEGQTEGARVGARDLAEMEDRLRASSTQGSFFEDRLHKTMVAPMLRSGKPIGALAISGLLLSQAALNALANLVAIELDKASAQQAAARAEAARQSQELKSALLDAIAHEFKTPLTTIRAASTAVLADCLKSPGDLKDLLTVVDEETDRLGRLVTDVIQTARIEAGQIQLKKKRHRVDLLIASVLHKMKSLIDGRPVDITISQPFIAAPLDEDLISLLLRQIVDNALKYSPPSSPLGIVAGATERDLVISVEDRGSGIPESEKERIFEKFYRLDANLQRIPGSGMGLTIARYIAQAHGGTVTVAGRPGGGSVFSLLLPLSDKEIVP